MDKLNWFPLLVFTFFPLFVFTNLATKRHPAYGEALVGTHILSLFGVLPLMLFIPKDSKFGRFKGAIYATMLTWVTTIPSSFPIFRILLLIFPVMLYGSITRFLKIEGKRKYIIFIFLFLFWSWRVEVSTKNVDNELKLNKPKTNSEASINAGTSVSPPDSVIVTPPDTGIEKVSIPMAK